MRGEAVTLIDNSADSHNHATVAFFCNSGPAMNTYPGKPLAPHWIVTSGPNNLAASPRSMVFPGTGVFAGWAGGPNSQGNNRAAAAIELKLNAALNRGISNLLTSQGNDLN